ncbi:MAG: TetR/AcrR family transcriptional regulator [Muribaculaceae bacterium]|nr:TetR/AcrR family transcriptional regulator [Muribaculaceae bacterium]
MNRIIKTEKLKEQILKNVLPLFLTKSYESISIPTIEDATHTTRGTLYKYFKNKENLFQQAITLFYNSPLNVLYAVPSSNYKLEDYWKIKIQQLQEAHKYIRSFGIFLDLVSLSHYIEIQGISLIPSFKEVIISNNQKNLKFWETVLINTFDYNIETGSSLQEIAVIYNAIFLQKCSTFPNCELSLPKLKIKT